MKEKILITGANGMIANHFYSLFYDKYDFVFLSRNPKAANEYFWDPEKKRIDLNAFSGIDHIINLAGASIAGEKWTEEYKRTILFSRIESTNFLKTSMMKYKCRVKTFISASAIGYYGRANTSTVFNEDSPAGKDFLAYVCQKWENEANEFLSLNLAERVVIPRIGIVLCHYGGVLPKMLLGRQVGIYTILGSGRQMVPWIHINDVCSFLNFTIQNRRIEGTFNLVAPQMLTYEEFIRTSARILCGKSYFKIQVPSLFFKIAMGERSFLLLKGCHISAQKLMNSGFCFYYPNLQKCIRSIYCKKIS